MKENTWCLSIWVWAISLSMIIYNSICLPLKLIILFFLRVKWYIIVSIDKIFTVHLSVDGNLDYLYFLVVIMTIEEQVPLWKTLESKSGIARSSDTSISAFLRNVHTDSHSFQGRWDRVQWSKKGKGLVRGRIKWVDDGNTQLKSKWGL